MSTLGNNKLASAYANIIARREQIFRSTWLPRQHADEDLARLPLQYLKDLYGPIWLFGPRGNIYVQQLQGLISQLDAYEQNLIPEPKFITDMQTFAKMFEVWRYAFRVEIENVRATDHRLMMISEVKSYLPRDFYKELRYHPALLRVDNDHPELRRNSMSIMKEFLNGFAFHSLNRDFIVGTKRDVDGLCSAFDTYCQRWGIPT